MKKIKFLLFFAILLFAWPCWGATETFYVCQGGDGSAPESDTCGTAYDIADLDTAANWDTDDQDDGKIGQNDDVVFMDDGGNLLVSGSQWDIPQSGTSGKPITFKAQSGDTPIIQMADGEDLNALVSIAAKGYLTFENLIFDGNAAGQSAGNDIILALSGAGGNHTYTSCTFRNSRATYGILSTMTGGTNVLTSCSFSGNPNTDCALSDSDGWTITSCVFVSEGSGVKMTNRTGGTGSVTVDSCTFTKWAESAAGFAVFSDTDGDDIVVKDNTFSDPGSLDYDCIQLNFQDDALTPTNPSNVQVYGNSITGGDDGDYGIVVNLGPTGNAVIYDNTLTSVKNTGIYLTGGASCVIRENYLDSIGVNGDGTHRCGIMLANINGKGVGTGNIVRSNIVNSCYNGMKTWGDVDDLQVNAVFANNTVYGYTTYGLYVHGYVTNATFKNNIFNSAETNAIHVKIDANSTAQVVLDYNSFFPEANDAWTWGATTDIDTLAAWKVASSQDANTINTDPKFVDAANDDFSLLATSPCIDTGVDLGAAFDDGLASDSSWPDSVSTEDQDLWGSGWEIGAYVFDTRIILLSGNNIIHQMSVITSRNILQVTGTDCLISNDTIKGTFDIDNDVTARNTAVPGTVSLANGKTLTANYCRFDQTKAVIEADGGTVTGGNNLFNVNDFGFTDETNDDFSLTSGSLLKNTGRSYNQDYDITGVTIPQGLGPDIGAYEYPYESHFYGDHETLYSDTSTTDLVPFELPDDYDLIHSDDDNLIAVSTKQNEYAIYLWRDKNDNHSDKIQATWIGKTNMPADQQSVCLQIYNVTDGSWQNLLCNTTVAANTEFTLQKTIETNVSDYYDVGDWVTFRVYQHW